MPTRHPHFKSGVVTSDGRWVVTGGHRAVTVKGSEDETDEVIVLKGKTLSQMKFESTAKLPYPVAGHCVVELKGRKLLVIGGISQGRMANGVVMVSMEDSSDSKELEPMKIPRVHCGCGVVRFGSGGGEEVVVAGGVGGYQAQFTTEVYSVKGITRAGVR